MKHARIWYIIADGGRARFVERDETGAYRTVLSFVAAEMHKRSRDLGLDRPARVKESANCGASRRRAPPRPARSRQGGFHRPRRRGDRGRARPRSIRPAGADRAARRAHRAEAEALQADRQDRGQRPPEGFDQGARSRPDRAHSPGPLTATSRLCHLTGAGRQADKSCGAMSIIRAILIAFIALSVAMPPLAGAKAYVHSPQGLSAAAQSDCCPDMDHCDKQTKGDCADLAGCALKCSSLSAVTPMPSGFVLRLSPAHRVIFVTDSASSRSTNPPSPPPRV